MLRQMAGPTGRAVKLVAALATTLALVVAGCGGDDESSGGGGKPQLTVSAAASLKEAFTDYGERFHDASARFSFAGSDELAAQIRKGVKPDVFAAANTKLPDELFAEGLVEKPTVVRGQPARARGARPTGRKVSSLEDLKGDGVKLAIGAEGRPDRHLHAHRARQAAAEARARRSSPTCAPRSPTSRASPASSRRARSTRASSTPPTCARPTAS